MPLPSLTGPLSANQGLSATLKMYTKILIGPEAFAINDVSGNVFCGTSDGLVWSLDVELKQEPKIVLFIGGLVLMRRGGISSNVEAFQAMSLTGAAAELLHKCQMMAREDKLRHNKFQEAQCGRPLGLQWVNGTLIVLDAYHGLFSLKEQADGSFSTSHVYDSKDSHQKLPMGPAGVRAAPMFLNDLVVVGNWEAVFMTDSSYKNSRQQNREEILDAAPRGRLLRLRLDVEGRGQVETVICGLHFPNGVVQHAHSRKLLVVESMRFRVLEANLDHLLAVSEEEMGECGETSELPRGSQIWVDNLPGFADNLTFDKILDSYWLGIGSKVSEPFSLLHMLLKMPKPWLRCLIGILIPMRYLEHFIPKYGMVLRLSPSGNIIQSLHDTTGTICLISEAMHHPINGLLYLGSSQNPYLGIANIMEGQ
jgi:sugar lactone lactonase YvrE